MSFSARISFSELARIGSINRIKQTNKLLNRGNTDRKHQQQKKKKINVEVLNKLLLTEIAAFIINITYKLWNYWTLNSAADVYVYNDLARFKFKRAASVDDVLFTSKDAYNVQAYKTVILTV
jgi:hypothetical protein